MPWSPDLAFINGLGFFSSCVALLQDADWQRASPCSEWTTLDVLGHVGAAVGLGTELLRGEQPVWSPSTPPGTKIAGDPRLWWEGLVTPARQAVETVDLTLVVESPVGRRTIGDALSFPALDLFVHAWDLARSVGADVVIPAEMIGLAHVFFSPIPSEQIRSPKVFADAVAAPPDATQSQDFIAWTGRNPRWAPPTED